MENYISTAPYGYNMTIVTIINFMSEVNYYILNKNLDKAESQAEEAQQEYHQYLEDISEPGINYCYEPGEQAAMIEVYEDAYIKAVKQLAIHTEPIWTTVID